MKIDDLKIGQIIYVPSNKDGTILPAKIVAKVTEETSSGNSTSIKLESPKGTIHTIDSLEDKEVYFSVEQAKEMLYERAVKRTQETLSETFKQIDKVLDFAFNIAKKRFGLIDESLEGKESKVQINEETNKVLQEE